MLETCRTLPTDAGKGRRVNEGKETFPMARRRYQAGCLFKRGKRRKMWVARWREEVIRTDGTVARTLRSEVLGSVSEIPSWREARKLLDARLRPINQGRHQLARECEGRVVSFSIRCSASSQRALGARQDDRATGCANGAPDRGAAGALLEAHRPLAQG